MTNLDKELDEVLAGFANYIVESIHLEPTSVKHIKLNQRQAKQAIQSFIAKEVRKARVDEALFVRYNSPPGDESGDWIATRIGELQAKLKEEV